MAKTDQGSRADGSGEIAGIGLAAFAAIAFGTLAISAKFAYREGAEALPLLASRFTLATAVLWVFLLATRRSPNVGRTKIVKLLLLGGLGYAFEASLFFAALERAPAGVVGLVFYSYPLWTTAIGFVTRLEPFRWRMVAALATGSAGVILVFSLPQGGLAGPLLALAASVAVAVYFILMQVMLADVDPSSAAFWTTAGAAIALIVVSAAIRQGLPMDALPAAGALGLASSVAFVALYAAIARIGSSRAAVAAMLEPIATLILAAALLSEEITIRIAFGAALVVSALPLLASTRARKAPTADAI